MTIFDQFRRENSNISNSLLLKKVNFATKIKIHHLWSFSRICSFWTKNGPLTHCGRGGFLLLLVKLTSFDQKREAWKCRQIQSSNCITFRLRTSRNRDKLASSGLLWYRFDRSQIHFYEPTSISLALVLRTLTLWDQQLLWCSNFNQLIL